MRIINLSTGEQIIVDVDGDKTMNTLDVGDSRSYMMGVTGIELLLLALEKRGCLVGDVDSAVEDALLNLGSIS